MQNEREGLGLVGCLIWTQPSDYISWVLIGLGCCPGIKPGSLGPGFIWSSATKRKPSSGSWSIWPEIGNLGVAAPGGSVRSSAASLSAQPFPASPRGAQPRERNAGHTVSAQSSASFRARPALGAMSCSRPPPDVDGMITLKVDNLTYRTSPDSLRRVFEKYGRVGDVYIPREHHTKAPRGFAFVRFHNRRDAEDAEDAMDGAELDGRELRVQMARYGRRDLPRSRQEEPRGRSGGGRSGLRSRSPRRRHRSRSRGPSCSRSRSRSHYGGSRYSRSPYSRSPYRRSHCRGSRYSQSYSRHHYSRSPYRESRYRRSPYIRSSRNRSLYNRSHSKSGSGSRSPSTSKSSSVRRSKSSSISRSCSRSRSRSTSRSTTPISKRKSKSRS
uniref:RRM domain-containing protein n=1 Tax=Macaca fascicularis TaxID=9541 RepID=A0A2K5WZV1_MACFA